MIGYFWVQTNSENHTGKIRVPFPEEASLSETKNGPVTEKHRLWYRRTFSVPKEWRGLEQHQLLASGFTQIADAETQQP